MKSWPEDRRVKFVREVDAYERTTLLLRDYRPVSMLHVPVHNVNRARFPVIESHTHYNDAEFVEQHYPPEAIVRSMDLCNIEKAIILTGMFGDKLKRCLEENVTPFPDRFIVFCQLDWTRFNEPGFGEQMVKQLRESVAMGVRGLKLNNHLGLDVFDGTGALAKVDDPRLDPVWDECGRLGLPVTIHISDPEAFFLPNGPTNERYQQLVAHPSWDFSRPGYPSKLSLLEARNRIFAKHPNTTFIGTHAGNSADDLDYCSDVLNRYPNFMVDLAARQAEMGRQPRRARQFFLEYQDRILFGTDVDTPGEEEFRSYYRWLETEDEYFDYCGWPRTGHWKIYGVGLPDSVLEKVYRTNAERILKEFKGLPT